MKRAHALLLSNSFITAKANALKTNMQFMQSSEQQVEPYTSGDPEHECQLSTAIAKTLIT